MRSLRSAAIRRLISLIRGSLARSSAAGVSGGLGASQDGLFFSLSDWSLPPSKGWIGPPLNENSEVSDDDSQGIWSPLVALLTPSWVLRSACSAFMPG